MLGTVYLLVRLVRRTVRSVWRATAGRPSRRLAAIAVGGALVAALVWAWWPDEVKYQPVQGNERGTITESLFAAHPRRTDRTLTVGERRTVTTVWPRTAVLPAPDQKRLALVLVPRDRGSADGSTQPPAWVFPFNPPARPGEGDNQALAVNTRDGSTVYDVAFALVWATDGTVDSRNEAYAFASCQGCRTVAVAFQVVLVAGQADVVVPKSIAAAVNYSCRDCLTSAVASQLVLTGMDRLSEDTRRRLTAIWHQIEEFGQQVQTLTPQEVGAQLEQYKKEILAAVGKDPVVASTAGAPLTTASPESRPTTAPAPTGTSAAASEQAMTTEPTTADQSATTEPTTSPAMPPSMGDTTTPPDTSSPAASAEPTPSETATADPSGDSGVVAG